VVEDLNQNGMPDIVVLNCAAPSGCIGGTVGVLINETSGLETTTVLMSSANLIQPNQPVTYTATVTGHGNDTITGTVSFRDGNSTKTVPVIAGIAVLTKPYSNTGPHVVTATYSGDNNNAGSISDALTEYVKKFPAASMTAVTTSDSPSLISQP